MGFRYTYKLNNVDITEYVSIGQFLVEKLQEPLDEGTTKLPFTMRDYEYEMRGLMEIKVVDNNDVERDFALLIYADEVEPSSRYGEYTHNISILEYTHKYDNYLYHTLTITKGTKNERLAPFEIVNQINSGPVESATSKNIFYKQPYVEVKESYEIGEVVFKQVSQAKQYNTSTALWDLKDVYLKTDAVGNTQQEISAGDVTFTFTESGRYKITMVCEVFNIISGENELQDFFEYYIRVVNSNYITVKKVLEIIRDTRPLESLLYHDDTRLFDIDPNISDYLDTIEIPQQFIQKATMRQVLNSIFLYVNAISRAKFDGVDNRDIMSMDEFNKTGNTFTLEELAEFKSNQDAYRLFNKGISWLEQALPDDLEEPSMKTPAEDYFKTVRSKDIQILENNFALKLERPIYQFKRIFVTLDEVTIEGFDSSTITLNDFQLELTSRFFNKLEWDLKLITVDFPTYDALTFWRYGIGLRENKGGTFYYTPNSSEIDLSPLFGEVLAEPVIKNVIEEALGEYFTLHTDTYGGDTFRQGVQINYVLVGGSDWWRNLRFNVEYITLENITIQTEREDTSYSKYYTEGRINQEDKRINTMLMSRKIYGDIQRSGVPNITIKKYLDDFSTLLELGDKTLDGYVVVDRKWEFHNEFIAMTYNLIKDHNRLSERINIDTHYRAYEIPQSNQVFERQETYADYVFIASPRTTLTEQITKLNGTYIMEILFGVLVNDWQDAITNGKTKITTAYVRTDGMGNVYDDETYKYGVLTPVTANGVKQGLSFTFGFDNNQSAGDGIRELSGNFYNNAVRYTDLDGEFRNLWFALSRVYEAPTDGWTDAEALSQYPLIRTSVFGGFGSPTNNYIQCGSMDESDINHDPLVIIKDPSQSIKINSQITVLSYEYLEYVIGQYFYSKNFLVVNPLEEQGVVVGEPKYLYQYTNGTRYGKFEDLKIKSGWASRLLISSATLVYDNSDKSWTFDNSISFSGVTSWAIGDYEGNLYLACNANYRGFKTFKSHFRYSMREIGNKEFVGSTSVNYDVTALVEATASYQILTVTPYYADFTIDNEVFLQAEKGIDLWINNVYVQENVNIDVQYMVANNIITIEHEVFITPIKGIDLYVEGYIQENVNLDVVYSNVNNTINIEHEVFITSPDNIDLYLEAYMQENVEISVQYTNTNRIITMTHQESMSVKYLDYQWVSGGTTPTVGQTCSISADEGNVRCDLVGYATCSWDVVDSFLNPTDITTNPTCSQGQTRYQCSAFGGQFLCQEEVGVLSDPIYDNCEICTEVEVDL